uniref:Uncharacterized protein LOC111109630 isoform X2 n=1 Tax=Crassostrea virginica TaxID=6565 RepID=A0A8B8BDR8_CRAVI|nr:uncharacterized protein LOC111109630 isoform X2 [Crassostrea virginica]
MSLLMKCTACSKSSENQLYSLLCLHFLCKDCFKCSIKIRTEASKEENGHSYIQCPTCEYQTSLGFSNSSQSEDLCKMPHVLKTLIDYQYGISSPECVVCKTRGSTTKSKFWCFQCADHFCPECLSFHSSLPNFEKHKTYSTEDLQNDPGIFIRARELCDKHDMRWTKICNDQGIPCCDSCISSDHIDVCKGEHKNMEEDLVTALVNPRLSQLKLSLAKVQQELRSLEKEMSNVENETNAFFIEENTIVQKKGQTIIRILLEKTDCLLAESFKTMIYKLQETESSILALHQKKSVLENAASIVSCLSGGSHVRSFLELKKIKNVLKDAREFLSKGEDHMPKISISFEVSTNKIVGSNSFGKIAHHQLVSDSFNPQIKAIGRWSSALNVSEKVNTILSPRERWNSEWNLSSAQTRGADLPGLKSFQFGGSMFVLSKSIKVDNNSSHITGCDWKSKNEIVIVDQRVTGTSEVCVYNTDKGDLISKIQLDEKPFDIVVLKDNDCVITFPKQEEIRIYSLIDHSLKNVVKVGFKCYGISYCSKKHMKTIAVAGEASIVLFDQNFTERKRLQVEGEDIRYIHAYSNNLLFYSDLQGNAVYSAVGNGENRFKYDSEIKFAAGLILDEFKNVYVCEKGSSFIHALSKSGDFQRKFEVGKTPTAISLSKDKKKICIICGGRRTFNMADIYIVK